MKKQLLNLLILISTTLATQNAVAILDFDGVGIEKSEAQILSNKLSSEIVKQGVFTVLERGEIDNILKEQGFQQKGCTSSECVVEVGQILGVSSMISGSIGKLEDIYYVEVKLIDVTTSQIIKNVDRSVEGGLKNVLINAIPQIAAELSGKIISPVHTNSSYQTVPQDFTYTPENRTSFGNNRGLVSTTTIEISTFYDNSLIYVDEKQVGKEETEIQLEKGSYKITERNQKGEILNTESIDVDGRGFLEVELGGRRKQFVIAPSVALSIPGTNEDHYYGEISYPPFLSLGFHIGFLVSLRDYHGLSFHYNNNSTQRNSYSDGFEGIIEESIYIGGFYTRLKEFDFSNIFKVGIGFSAGFRYTENIIYEFDGTQTNEPDYYYSSNYVDSKTEVHNDRFDFGGPAARVALGYKKVFFAISYLQAFGGDDSFSFSTTPEFDFMILLTL